MENQFFKEYVRMQKPKAYHQEPDSTINIKSTGSTQKYIAHGAKLLINEKFGKIVLNASGNAVNKALMTADLLRKKIKGLAQINEIVSKEVEDEYQGKNPEKPKIKITKNLAILQIILSDEANLDKNHFGYQPPFALEKIKEFGTTFLPKEGFYFYLNYEIINFLIEKKEKTKKKNKLKKFIAKRKKLTKTNSPKLPPSANPKLYLVKNKTIEKPS